MDKLLIAAGIAIIIFMLWKDWAKEAIVQREMEDGRILLAEMADVRKEVQVLLDQLETASEKIVDEISYGLEEIKIQVSSAVEKSGREDSGAVTDVRKISSSKVVKRLRSEKSSKPNSSNLTSNRSNPEKLSTAAPRRQRTDIKRERDIPSGKETYEKGVPPKHQMVYAMADMGHTEEDIAKQMKIGKGEVSLLLQLRRKGVEGNV